jgi:hypothetical protein
VVYGEEEQMPTLYDKEIEKMNEDLKRWGKPIASLDTIRIVSAYVGVAMGIGFILWWFI